MGFKAVRAARVPLELGKLEGEEVVGRISKRCVTQAVQDDTNERSFIVSADADGEVVTEHCEYVWIKLIMTTSNARTELIVVLNIMI